MKAFVILKISKLEEPITDILFFYWAFHILLYRLKISKESINWNCSDEVEILLSFFFTFMA